MVLEGWFLCIEGHLAIQHFLTENLADSLIDFEDNGQERILAEADLCPAFSDPGMITCIRSMQSFYEGRTQRSR